LIEGELERRGRRQRARQSSQGSSPTYLVCRPRKGKASVPLRPAAAKLLAEKERAARAERPRPADDGSEG